MNKNLKIEYSTRRNTDKSLYRYVFWRVVPSELGIFRRLFCNPWREIYMYDSNGYSNDLFSASEYKALVNSCKTVGDVIERDQKFRRLQDSIWKI